MVATNLTSHLTMTEHAVSRCKERRIDGRCLGALLEFGTTYLERDDRIAVFLGRRAVREARRRYGVDLSQWENTAAVISPDWALVTVLRVDRPKARWRDGR